MEDSKDSKDGWDGSNPYAYGRPQEAKHAFGRTNNWDVYLPLTGHVIEDILVFGDDATLYVAGREPGTDMFRLLWFKRTISENPMENDLSTVITEDPNRYSYQEVLETQGQVLSSFDKDRTKPKSARVSTTAVGLLGLVRLLRGTYLLFAKSCEDIGVIGSHRVHTPTRTELVPVHYFPSKERSMWKKLKEKFSKPPDAVAESRYRSIFSMMDVTRDCFFSYTYDLTRYLQQNVVFAPRTYSAEKDYAEEHPRAPQVDTPAAGWQGGKRKPRDMFIWNHYLLEPLQGIVSQCWLLPIVHGFFHQTPFTFVGRKFTFSLIARRSRHFAGTRYLKRGVNEEGCAANEVEIEQLVDDQAGHFSSYVQLRASIPLFWSQETSIAKPKPVIQISKPDSTYDAARLHFSKLFERYGSPTLCLNLVKKSYSKREDTVGSRFGLAVQNLNTSLPARHRIQYLPFDFSMMEKKRKIMSGLHDLSVWALNNTGFFSTTVAQTVEKRKGASERGSAAAYSAKKAATALGLNLENEEETEYGYLWRRRAHDLHIVLGSGLTWDSKGSLKASKWQGRRSKAKEDVEKDDIDILNSWQDWRPRYTYVQQLSRRIHVPYFLPLPCGVASASNWGFSSKKEKNTHLPARKSKKQPLPSWTSEGNRMRSRSGMNIEDVEAIERPTDYDRQLADVLAYEAARTGVQLLQAESDASKPQPPAPKQQKSQFSSPPPPWLSRIVPMGTGTRRQVLRGFGPRKRRHKSGGPRSMLVYSQQSRSQLAIGKSNADGAVALRFGRSFRQALVRPVHNLLQENPYGNTKSAPWFHKYKRDKHRHSRASSSSSLASEAGVEVARPTRLHIIENYAPAVLVPYTASSTAEEDASPVTLDPTSPPVRRSLLQFQGMWNRRLGNPRAASSALAAAAAAAAAVGRSSWAQARDGPQFELSGGLYAELFGFDNDLGPLPAEDDAWNGLQHARSLQQRVDASTRRLRRSSEEEAAAVGRKYDSSKQKSVELMIMNKCTQVHDSLVAARLAGSCPYVMCVGDGVHPHVEARRSKFSCPERVDSLLRQVEAAASYSQLSAAAQGSKSSRNALLPLDSPSSESVFLSPSTAIAPANAPSASFRIPQGPAPAPSIYLDLPLSEARRALLHGETQDPVSDSMLLHWRVNANHSPRAVPPTVPLPLRPPPRPWEAFALDGHYAAEALPPSAKNSRMFPSKLFPSTLMLHTLKRLWNSTSLAGHGDPSWTDFLEQARAEGDTEESFQEEGGFMGHHDGGTIKPLWKVSTVVRNRMFALGARMRSWINMGGLSNYCYVDLHGRSNTYLDDKIPSDAWKESFVHVDELGAMPPGGLRQRGILRSNCIDCLDRTNEAQLSVGVHALGLQLHALGYIKATQLDPRGRVVMDIMDLYTLMGDRIALQYGGSEAHRKVRRRHGEASDAPQDEMSGGGDIIEEGSGKVKKRSKILTSLKRYYSNSFRDALKQDAINLFLGLYKPYRDYRQFKLHLWELDDDHDLHNPSTALTEAMYPRGIGGRFGGYSGRLVNVAHTTTTGGNSLDSLGIKSPNTLLAEAKKRASERAEAVGRAQPVAVPSVEPQPYSHSRDMSFASSTPRSVASPALLSSPAFMSPRAVMLAEARGKRGVALANVDRSPRDCLGRPTTPFDWWRKPLLEFQGNGLPVLGMPLHSVTGQYYNARVWSPIRDARGKPGPWLLWDGRPMKASLEEKTRAPSSDSPSEHTSQAPAPILVRYNDKTVDKASSLLSLPRIEQRLEAYPDAMPCTSEERSAAVRFWEQVARDEADMELSTPLLWGARAVWSYIERLTPLPSMAEEGTASVSSGATEGGPSSAAMVAYSAPPEGDATSWATYLTMGNIARCYTYWYSQSRSASPAWLIRSLSQGGPMHNVMVHGGIMGAAPEPLRKPPQPLRDAPLPLGRGVRPTHGLQFIFLSKLLNAPFLAHSESNIGKSGEEKATTIKSVPSTLSSNLPPASSTRHFKPDTGMLAHPEAVPPRKAVRAPKKSSSTTVKPRSAAPPPWRDNDKTTNPDGTPGGMDIPDDSNIPDEVLQENRKMALRIEHPFIKAKDALFEPVIKKRKAKVEEPEPHIRTSLSRLRSSTSVSRKSLASGDSSAGPQLNDRCDEATYARYLTFSDKYHEVSSKAPEGTRSLKCSTWLRSELLEMRVEEERDEYIRAVHPLPFDQEDVHSEGHWARQNGLTERLEYGPFAGLVKHRPVYTLLQPLRKTWKEEFDEGAGKSYSSFLDLESYANCGVDPPPRVCIDYSQSAQTAEYREVVGWNRKYQQVLRKTSSRHA